MDKLLTAYESACIFVELCPGPDKLLEEAVARLHEIDAIIKEVDKDKLEFCSNCGDNKCKASQENSSIVKKCGQWKPNLKDSNQGFVAAMRRRKRGQSYSPKDVFSLCEIIDSLEDENRQWQETVKAIKEHRDQLQREVESGEKVICEYKEKLQTASLKLITNALTYAKELSKLKTEISDLEKKEGN